MEIWIYYSIIFKLSLDYFLNTSNILGFSLKKLAKILLPKDFDENQCLDFIVPISFSF